MDSTYATQVAQSQSQQDAQEDASEDQAAMWRRSADAQYGQPGYGSPYGSSMPNYNGGVMPAHEGGFEEYVAHHLGVPQVGVKAKVGENANVLGAGIYKGMSRAEAYEKAREDYAALPDDQKKQWESKTFNQNDRRPGEHLFQYPSNDPQANAGPSYQDIANGRAPSPSSSAQNPYQSPSLATGSQPRPAVGQQTPSFNPGSTGGSGPLANNDTRLHYGISQAAGTDYSGINNGGTHQPDAVAPGQYQRSGLSSLPNVVQQPSYNVTPSNFASTISPRGMNQQLNQPPAGPQAGFAGIPSKPTIAGQNMMFPGVDRGTSLIPHPDFNAPSSDVGMINGRPASDYDNGGIAMRPGMPQRVVPQVGGPAAGPTGSASVQPSRQPNYNAAPMPKPLVAPPAASMAVR